MGSENKGADQVCRFSRDAANIYIVILINLKEKYKSQSTNKSLDCLLAVHEIPVKDYMSRITRKPNFGVSAHVLHKPGCTAKEDG